MDITGNSPPEPLIRIINQIFEIEKKAHRLETGSSVMRNIRRIRDSFEEMGFTYDNPIGESYDETRTDCEASISGTYLENLKITEVIKPVIRLNSDGFSQIVQRGIVIVEGDGPKNNVT